MDQPITITITARGQFYVPTPFFFDVVARAFKTFAARYDTAKGWLFTADKWDQERVEALLKIGYPHHQVKYQTLGELNMTEKGSCPECGEPQAVVTGRYVTHDAPNSNKRCSGSNGRATTMEIRSAQRSRAVMIKPQQRSIDGVNRFGGIDV